MTGWIRRYYFPLDAPGCAMAIPVGMGCYVEPSRPKSWDEILEAKRAGDAVWAPPDSELSESECVYLICTPTLTNHITETSSKWASEYDS